MRSKIPLTVSQQDVGMAEDLTGKIPFFEAAAKNNSVPLVEAKDSFKYMKVQPPELGVGEIPACKKLYPLFH